MSKLTSRTSAGLAATAGLALLAAWYFLGRRPGSADTLPSFTQGVSDQVVGSPADMIDKAHEALWNINYSGRSSGLNGYVPWPTFPVTGLKDAGVLGNIRHTGKHNTGTACGSGGRWFNDPTRISFTYRGTKVGSIRGDARALYSLMLLCAQSNLDQLAHLGMYNLNGGSDTSHDYGYAIDIPVSQPKGSGHDVMERFITAARSMNMPIAWVSPYRDGNVWPMFQLRGGFKIRFSYSKQNHNDHYHLVLPRPNFALPAIEVRP